MEFRYLGFEQHQNARDYQYDVLVKGEPVRRFIVTADLALFLAHHVGIQEGPSLCAQKLANDLEQSQEGTHKLTEDDLRAHTAARATAEARKAEARKTGPRRSTTAAPAQERTPWRTFGL
jgi:hypothetical protein